MCDVEDLQVAVGPLARRRQPFHSLPPPLADLFELLIHLPQPGVVAQHLFLTHGTAAGDTVGIAFVFGSMARGKESAGSDVDVILIGQLGFRQAVEMLEDRLGKRP